MLLKNHDGILAHGSAFCLGCLGNLLLQFFREIKAKEAVVFFFDGGGGGFGGVCVGGCHIPMVKVSEYPRLGCKGFQDNFRIFLMGRWI